MIQVLGVLGVLQQVGNRSWQFGHCKSNNIVLEKSTVKLITLLCRNGEESRDERILREDACCLHHSPACFLMNPQLVLTTELDSPQKPLGNLNDCIAQSVAVVLLQAAFDGGELVFQQLAELEDALLVVESGIEGDYAQIVGPGKVLK
jgi:hypothetical protein